MRRKDRAQPGAWPMERLPGVRSVRAFDEAFTAPHFGFDGAEDYYHRASAMRVVDRIRLPALIITAEDDPFVPSAPFRDPRVASNPHITLMLTRHGGHCGFIEPRSDGYDGYWAEREILTFAIDVCSSQSRVCRDRTE
jgi:predicted alpha/beta-fold hydrolase